MGEFEFIASFQAWSESLVKEEIELISILLPWPNWEITPSPIALFGSLRALNYSVESSIADIVDNSMGRHGQYCSRFHLERR